MAPVITFLYLVRTKAAPLPGFTCWNSTTVQTLPSFSKVTPLRKSPAVIVGINDPPLKSQEKLTSRPPLYLYKNSSAILSYVVR
jgi:hypothetical protein